MALPRVSRLTIHPSVVEQAAPTSLVVERRPRSVIVVQAPVPGWSCGHQRSAIIHVFSDGQGRGCNLHVLDQAAPGRGCGCETFVAAC